MSSTALRSNSQPDDPESANRKENRLLTPLVLVLSMLLAIIVLVSLVFIFFYLSQPKTIKDWFSLDNRELFPSTFEFFLIAIIGGIITILLTTLVGQVDQRRARREKELDEKRKSHEKELEETRARHEKELDRRQEEQRFLREVQTQLLDAYNQAKTARRHLRAHLHVVGEVGEFWISANEYEKQIELVNTAQLTFEAYARRLKLWLCEPKPNEIAEALDRAECYLNEIVEEYESQFKNFKSAPHEQALKELPCLGEFLEKYNEAGPFSTRFGKQVEKALEQLETADLCSPRMSKGR